MSQYGFKNEFIKPDPRESPESFLGPRLESANRITKEVRTSLATGRPCKMVIYGLFGIGKTHLVFKIMSGLHDVVNTYYVEMPSCHRRSKFRDLEQAMMKKVGKSDFMKYLKKCFEECDEKTSEVQNVLGIDADLAEVMKKGLENDETILWRYLLGEKITSSNMITLSALKPQIDDLEASRVISLTSKLFSMYTGKKILFVVDEMEKTAPLTGDSMTAYRDAIRDLVDSSNNVAVIFVSTARELTDFRLLNDDPIKRRIGLHNIKYFKPYDDDSELLAIMKDVIMFERNRKFPFEEKISEIKSDEKVTIETYPYSDKALAEIINYVHDLAENVTEGIPAVRPNEILQLMDLCLTKAKENNLSHIDSKLVKEAEKEFTSGTSPDVI